MSKPFPYRMVQFMDAIKAFNTMYKLPLADFPTLTAVVNHQGNLPQYNAPYVQETPEQLVFDRIGDFTETMQSEVAEAADIQASLHHGIRTSATEGHIQDTNGNPIPYKDIDALTDMADWLGDMVIYCFSEAAKYGLPMDKILEIIMDSNMSKLGPDGNPIYDSKGKVCKGPYYWKPEPKIKELLEAMIYSHERKANAHYKELCSFEPTKAPAPNPEDICLWPDGTYCAYTELAEFSHMSDDYEIVDYDKWDVAGGCKKQ